MKVLLRKGISDLPKGKKYKLRLCSQSKVKNGVLCSMYAVIYIVTLHTYFVHLFTLHKVSLICFK